MVLDKIFQIYQRFYAQRSVLQAVTLTIDVTRMGISDFPREKALDELSAVVSYLLGQKDARRLPFDNCIQIVQRSYANQPFWYELLLDYFDVLLDVEADALDKQSDELYGRASALLAKIHEQDARREAVISDYASKIVAEKFHVDAKSLIRNYLKMTKHDAKQAWDVLISNPAYFSPIIVTDPQTGLQVLSPMQASEENKRLGHFLKGLRG